MTVEQIIGLSLALMLMLVALAGNVIPGVPGTPFALVPVVAHRLYFGEDSVSILVLIVLVILALVSVLLDYLATMFGAKKLGATWRGVVGAVLGALIGLLFGLPGIVLGPFLGATLLEMAGRQEFKKAAKAGSGAVLGLFVGAMGRLAVCGVMIGLFTANVVYRSVS